MNKPKFTYSYHHGYWRVYEMKYIDNSSYGTEIDYFINKDEAINEVYRLNGWKPKQTLQH